MQKKSPTALWAAPTNGSSLVEREHYKGIFYVRLSALPVDQKSRIRASSFRHTIINILKDDILMNDCMSYADYVEWHLQNFIPANSHTQQDTPVGPTLSAHEFIHYA
jgi:hypothetical protein